MQRVCYNIMYSCYNIIYDCSSNDIGQFALYTEIMCYSAKPLSDVLDSDHVYIYIHYYARGNSKTDRIRPRAAWNEYYQMVIVYFGLYISTYSVQFMGIEHNTWTILVVYFQTFKLYMYMQDRSWRQALGASGQVCAIIENCKLLPERWVCRLIRL